MPTYSAGGFRPFIGLEERVIGGCGELRAEGSAGGPLRVSGVLLAWNEWAEIRGGEQVLFRERFAPGAFGDLADVDVSLDLQHDRRRLLARTAGGGMELRDDGRAVQLRADLVPTDESVRAHRLLEGGVLRGLSVAFRVLRVGARLGEVWGQGDRWRERTITRARMLGIGLVDRPAYTSSLAEARECGIDTEGGRGRGPGGPAGVDRPDLERGAGVVGVESVRSRGLLV